MFNEMIIFYFWRIYGFYKMILWISLRILKGLLIFGLLVEYFLEIFLNIGKYKDFICLDWSDFMVEINFEVLFLYVVIFIVIELKLFLFENFIWVWLLFLLFDCVWWCLVIMGKLYWWKFIFYFFFK